MELLAEEEEHLLLVALGFAVLHLEIGILLFQLQQTTK